MVGKTALNKEMKHLNGAYFRTNITCDPDSTLIQSSLNFLLKVGLPRLHYK